MVFGPPAPTTSVTGYKWCCFLMISLDTPGCFLWNLSLMFLRHFVCKYPFFLKIKTFRLDGRGEYMSSQFQKLLFESGILHQVSCPFTPKQNGCAYYPWLIFLETNLESHTRQCVFIGCSLNYKGYKCLDVATMRAFLSRHVMFDFPFSNLVSPHNSPTLAYPTDFFLSFLFLAWL